MRISKKKEVVITKDYILDRIGSESIYRAEMPELVIGRAIRSPLRQDNSPSFCVFIGEDGHLHHVDYADDRYKGGCIDLVMQKYGITFREAVNKIARDWGLIEGKQLYTPQEVKSEEKLEITRRKCLIQVHTRPWKAEDARYWGKYGITRDMLTSEHVWPISELFIDRRREVLGKDELVYCYEYEDGLKIYMPQRQKNEKWKSNISTRKVEGLETLNGHQKVVVTKSLKDRLTLTAILPEDVAVINTQNESISAWTDELLKVLEGRSVWISYDSDPPGKQASRRVNERYPWMKHINVPDIYNPLKDWGDMVSVHGQQVVYDHFKTKNVI